MPKKYFAEIDSSGSSLQNLQLASWQAAVRQFDWVKSQYDEYANGDDPDHEPDYCDENYVADAAVAITLAGASLGQMLGQNAKYPGNRNRVPTPLELFDLVAANSKLAADFAKLRGDFKKFIDVYDCLRHFGPPKHEAVKTLESLDDFADLMKTAQQTWQLVIRNRGGNPGADFQHSFDFDQ